MLVKLKRSNDMNQDAELISAYEEELARAQEP